MRDTLPNRPITNKIFRYLIYPYWFMSMLRIQSYQISHSTKLQSLSLFNITLSLLDCSVTGLAGVLTPGTINFLFRNFFYWFQNFSQNMPLWLEPNINSLSTWNYPGLFIFTDSLWHLYYSRGVISYYCSFLKGARLVVWLQRHYIMLINTYYPCTDVLSAVNINTLVFLIVFFFINRISC